MPILPITLAVVAPEPDMNLITAVYPSAGQSHAWWRDNIGIDLQIHVQGVVVPELNPNYLFVNDSDFYEPLWMATRWIVQRDQPILFIFPQLGSLTSQSYLGLAWRSPGFAVIAGASQVILDEIIDHELAHLLGLKHIDGTFMDELLELHHRFVTDSQRSQLLELSYLK